MAITEYLAERHIGVWPTSPVARARSRSAAAEMHSGFATLRQICTMNCGLRIRLEVISEEALRAGTVLDDLRKC